MKPKLTDEQMAAVAHLGVKHDLVNSVKERIILPSYHFHGVLRNADDTLRIHVVIAHDGFVCGMVREERSIVTVQSYGRPTVQVVDRQMTVIL